MKIVKLTMYDEEEMVDAKHGNERIYDGI